MKEYRITVQRELNVRLVPLKSFVEVFGDNLKEREFILDSQEQCRLDREGELDVLYARTDVCGPALDMYYDSLKTVMKEAGYRESEVDFVWEKIHADVLGLEG